MNYFVRYGQAGQITAVSCGDGISMAAGAAGTVMQAAAIVDNESCYVVDGKITDRPAMTYTRNQETLSGLPRPCHVVVFGPVDDEFDCSDGEVQFSFSEPGEYTAYITAFPFKKSVEAFNVT